MADEITPRFNLVKPEVGGSADTWGDKWNENADKIDAAIIRLDEENVWSAPQRFDGPLRVGPETGAGVVLRGDGSLDAEGGLYDGGERVYSPKNIADLVSDGDLVQTSRTISTGTGLTGGGNLSANRTISLASSHWPIGVGQTWQNMTGSREGGTTYTNTTGRTIAVAVMMNDSASAPFNGTVTFVVGGIGVARITSASPIFAIVPPGSTYRLNIVGSANIFRWFELM